MPKPPFSLTCGSQYLAIINAYTHLGVVLGGGGSCIHLFITTRSSVYSKWANSSKYDVYINKLRQTIIIPSRTARVLAVSPEHVK